MANKRWVCPSGEHPGQLAPGKMRKDDLRRYCIPCSTKKGRLVERVAPSLVKVREEKAEARKVKVKQINLRQKQKVAAEWTFDGVDMRTEFARLKKLDLWDTLKVRAAIDRTHLLMRRGTKGGAGGHAKTLGWHRDLKGQIVVTAGRASWWAISEVILHEMAHHAHHALGLHRRGTGNKNIDHDGEFHDILRTAAQQAYELDGAAIREAYKAEGGAARAYSMDRALERVMQVKYGTKARNHTPKQAKSEAKQWRVIPGEVTQFEIQIPGCLVACLNADDWHGGGYFGDEKSDRLSQALAKNMVVRRAGKGYTAIFRGTQEEMEFLMEEVENRTGMMNDVGEDRAITVAMKRFERMYKEFGWPIPRKLLHFDMR